MGQPSGVALMQPDRGPISPLPGPEAQLLQRDSFRLRLRLSLRQRRRRCVEMRLETQFPATVSSGSFPLGDIGIRGDHHLIPNPLLLQQHHQGAPGAGLRPAAREPALGSGSGAWKSRNRPPGPPGEERGVYKEKVPALKGRGDHQYTVAVTQCQMRRLAKRHTLSEQEPLFRNRKLKTPSRLLTPKPPRFSRRRIST